MFKIAICDDETVFAEEERIKVSLEGRRQYNGLPQGRLWICMRQRPDSFLGVVYRYFA